MKGLFPAGILSLLLIASTCKKNVDSITEAPFIITGANCQKWVGGEESAGDGVDLEIYVDSAQVELDSVYFRGFIVPLTQKSKNNKLLYTASINASNPVTMDQRFTNLPDLQAMIIYKLGDKTRYFLVKNIEEKEPVYQP